MKPKAVPLALAGVTLTAAGAVLASQVPVVADPTYMSRTEFDAINAGQSKAKVESNCLCSGQQTQFADIKNGNKYWYWMYQSHVGWPYIGFRWNGSAWIEGDTKYWCVAPYGDLGIPEGDCEKYPS